MSHPRAFPTSERESGIISPKPLSRTRALLQDCGLFQYPTCEGVEVGDFDRLGSADVDCDEVGEFIKVRLVKVKGFDFVGVGV